MKKVLVTGISGWIAQFCAVELIKQKFVVRGSLRTMSRQDEIKTAIGNAVNYSNQLEFCELDLLKDQGWDDAMQGCDYVLHVASPFIMENPKDENLLIKPAKEGTLRMLKAAQKSKIKRIVLTSSIAAMAAHKKSGSFGPADWTDLTAPQVTAYEKSKTIAEKAAWDFIQENQDNHQMELTTINPGAVMGPTLGPDIDGVSLGICAQMLTKKIPGIPNIAFPMVDVRDVALLHVRALTIPEAKGKRFIAAEAKPTYMIKLAQTLKENGYDVPTKKIPSIVVKFMGLFDKEARGMKAYLDRYVTCDNSETINILKWQPMLLENTFIEMAKTVQRELKRTD